MDNSFSEYYYKKAEELLIGASDMHTHSTPCIFPRRADDHQTAVETGEFGMVAVVLKNHEVETAARAQILRSGPKLPRVFGGVVLNHFIGGLNPVAVETSLLLEGSFVWFPTVSAAQHVRFYESRVPFLGHTLKHVSGAGFR